MKKMLALILSGVLILSLTACGGQADTGANDNSAETTDNQAETTDNPTEATDNQTDANISSTEEFLKTITPETAEAKGVCGADLTWYYQDNVLVIKGTGPMSDFFAKDPGAFSGEDPETTQPWEEYLSDIGMIIIDDGCTSIGSNAFRYCTSLSKITMPDEIKSIGDSAFMYCGNLSKIELPDCLETIGEYAFNKCSSLKEMTFPASLENLDDAFSEGVELDTVTFLGDAPEGIKSMVSDVRPSGKSVEVYYSGSGFEEWIEWHSADYSIIWIKQ